MQPVKLKSFFHVNSPYTDNITPHQNRILCQMNVIAGFENGIFKRRYRMWNVMKHASCINTHICMLTRSGFHGMQLIERLRKKLQLCIHFHMNINMQVIGIHNTWRCTHNDHFQMICQSSRPIMRQFIGSIMITLF